MNVLKALEFVMSIFTGVSEYFEKNPDQKKKVMEQIISFYKFVAKKNIEESSSSQAK